MDFSTVRVIDSIRDERLELAEILAKNRQRMLDTLNYLENTSPSMLQNIEPVFRRVPSTEEADHLNDEQSGHVGAKTPIKDK